MDHDRRVRGRLGGPLRREPPRRSARRRPRRARVRHVRDRHVRDALLVRVRQPDALGADLRRHRGRVALRPARRRAAADLPLSVPRVRGVVARAPFPRRAGVHMGSRYVPVRRLPDHGRDRRLAGKPARPRGRDRGGARTRSGDAARRARAPCRRPRGGEPLRPRARVVARPRPGVQRVHPRAAAARGVRTRDARARGEGARGGDGRRGPRHRPRLPAGVGPARRGLRARAGARGEARLPRVDPPAHVSRRGGPAQAGPAEPRPCAAASRAAHDRDARPRPRRGRRVLACGGRARLAARQARRDCGSEHPGVRGGAQHGRRAAATVRFACGLRLARVARAAQSDGGSDRRSAHAAGTVARADAGPARVVPRADRQRDVASRAADRRRARHLADRGGDVQLHLQRRRPRRAAARRRRRGWARPGRGAADHGRGDAAARAR
jgi:hypothetical protein